MSKNVYCDGCEYYDGSSFCYAPNVVKTFFGKKQENQVAFRKNTNNDCSDFWPDGRGWFQKFLDHNFRQFDDHEGP